MNSRSLVDVSTPPLTTITWPGSKTELIIFSKIKLVFEEYSEGLSTTVLPAAIAPINGAIDNWKG